MRIRWTPAAAPDLEQIKDYLKERYPNFAQPTVLRLYQGVRSLKKDTLPWPPGARGRNARVGFCASALYSRVPRKEGSHRHPALPPHRAGSALKNDPDRVRFPEDTPWAHEALGVIVVSYESQDYNS